mmetsp:Transcript_28798/g.58696  ORF Transcript_28798/g.58696 Transcript_28798/m.58696 type:complete len:773 (+) Transcript_28798:91-2409(+)
MSDEFTIRVSGVSPTPESTGRGKAVKGVASNSKNISQLQRRYNLRLRPSTSLDQLEQDVSALFNIPKTFKCKISFLSGFPPKPLDSFGKSTVEELGIRPNEGIIVKFETGGSVASAGSREIKVDVKRSNRDDSSTIVKTTVDPDSNPTITKATSSSRPKRASSMAASASFQDVIAAQDAISKKEKSSNKKKTTTSQGVHQLNNSAGKRRNSAASKEKAKKVKMEGTGYRLSDGRSFEPASPSNKSNRKKQGAMFKSEDDIANSLLSSLGGSSGGGNVGKFLRAAMRGAVAKSYEASRAGVRVDAVNQGDYNFQRVKGGSVGEDGKGVVLGTPKDYDSTGDVNGDEEIVNSTLFSVSYSKGMEGRGHYTERVEIIALDTLKGVVQTVYDTKSDYDDVDNGSDSNHDGKEMLRPVSIAQLSPRVFWSLVYHHGIHEKKKQLSSSRKLGKPSVEDMLREFIPHLDWSHLDRGGRKRVLSEKAKENLRQERQATILSMPDTNEFDQQEGIRAIEEMEKSIMNTIMPDDDGIDQDLIEINDRERRANAAMARLANSGSRPIPQNNTAASIYENGDAWVLVTPPDEDVDELVECIMDGLTTGDGKSKPETYGEEEAKIWAVQLQQLEPNSTNHPPLLISTPIRNWRELANSHPHDVSKIISSRKSVSDPSLPSIETIEKWIDSAQQRSVEEIMLEILDSDQDALDALLEKAKSGCPKDLSYWRAVPKSLLDTIIGTSQFDHSTNNHGWTERDVQRWTQRAEKALQTCPWLDLYTTPVA